MKTTTTLLFLFLGFFCHSQNEKQSRSLDPRQFVEVYYHKNRSGITTCIGQIDSTTQIFHQRVNRIDNDGVIDIRFLIDELSSTSNFYGAISIEAEVYGRDGSRKIEVNPYSLVGQDQTEFGIKSLSINDLSDKVRNFQKKIMDLTWHYNQLRDQLVDRNQMLSIHLLNIGYRAFDEDAGIDYSLDYYFDSPAQDSIYVNYLTLNKNEIRDLILSQLSDTLKKKEISLFFAKLSFNYSDIDFIKNFVSKSVKDRIIENLTNLSSNKKTETESQILLVQRELALITQYLESIVNSGEDTRRAFSTLSGFDEMTVQELLNSIISTSRMSLNKNEDLIKWYDNLIQNVDGLNKLSSWLGYQIGNRDLNKTLSELIYSKLVNAQIDCTKENIQVGERLNIYILWNDANKENEATKLNLCSFYVDQTGAQFKIMDAFYLVERINQGKGDSLKSPSNFKGAGGASLMLSYYKNDLRSNSIQKDVKGNKCNVFWNTMNALQPSFGLNVSYLDFDVTKDFEIGTGLCLGFFRNQLMFTYGLNLHKAHENWYNASYFGIGFSFINIADNIRERK